MSIMLNNTEIKKINMDNTGIKHVIYDDIEVFPNISNIDFLTDNFIVYTGSVSYHGSTTLLNSKTTLPDIYASFRANSYYDPMIGISALFEVDGYDIKTTSNSILDIDAVFYIGPSQWRYTPGYGGTYGVQIQGPGYYSLDIYIDMNNGGSSYYAPDTYVGRITRSVNLSDGIANYMYILGLGEGSTYSGYWYASYKIVINRLKLLNISLV